jgi:endo-1,4-beta-xylanase
MKKNLIFCLSVFLFTVVFISCKKKEVVYETSFPNATDTSGTLKDATNITMGVAIDETPTLTNSGYVNIVKREFDAATLSYSMKHGAVVQSDGSLNFTTADAMINACGPNVQIFGHTLGWHENQNASYLKTFSGIVAGTGPDLSINGGFESNLNNWGVWNGANATVSVGSGGNEVRTGTKSMKVVNAVADPANQWKTQIAGDLVTTNIGGSYKISYWIKAVAPGSVRLSTNTAGGGGPQYQGDQVIGTSWQNVSWNITANSPQTRVVFDMAAVATTYFVDDVTVQELSAVQIGPVVAQKLDIALNNFITGMVNHYKTRVRSWDVVNEIFANDGKIRNSTNTPATATDAFVWEEYLGRDFAFKAFTYANAADPTATLYINDYGLEYNPVKLDSLIAYVKELKTRGAKVDGIGTQMHMDYLTRHDGIDAMMQKLAATGLKIRISELDVKTNTLNASPYVQTPLDRFGQEEMYRYVINSYKKYIPAAQQGGITIWGLHDTSSWLYNNGKEFPLLFNGNFSKKSTYAAALSALK